MNLHIEDNTADLFAGESLVENVSSVLEKPADIPNPF